MWFYKIYPPLKCTAPRICYHAAFHTPTRNLIKENKMLKSKSVYTALFAALAFGAAAPSFADDDDRHYRQHRAKYISHQKAAQKAVAHVGGGTAKSVDFEYSTRKGAYFDVEVRTRNGREYDVKVDAKTGKIRSARLDN